MTFQRTHLQRLESRMREKRRFIQVLAGPRQVGKTTLAQQLMQQLGDTPTYYTAADAVANAGIAWIEQQWETARLTLQQSGASELVLVIDEV